MTDPVTAFQPAIDALEADLADLERQANALITTINVLRGKAGMPPRPGGLAPVGDGHEAKGSSSGAFKIKSDAFTGKKLGSAVREYLEMRKAHGLDAPATTREIFDALKDGGFVSGAKDDATGMVVLRTMLRKNTTMFAKLQNGKIGLRSWYPGLRAPKESAADKTAAEADDAADAETEEETEEEAEVDDLSDILGTDKDGAKVA